MSIWMNDLKFLNKFPVITQKSKKCSHILFVHLMLMSRMAVTLCSGIAKDPQPITRTRYSTCFLLKVLKAFFDTYNDHTVSQTWCSLLMLGGLLQFGEYLDSYQI